MSNGFDMLNRQNGVSALCILGAFLMGRPSESLPKADSDWEVLVRVARQHGLSALLYRQARLASGEPGIPPAVTNVLRRDYMVAVAQTMTVERELAQALNALHTAGVPAAVLKGAALGAYYPAPSLRTYGDIDLWVRREHLDLAEQTLNNLGYQATQSREWALEQGHHLPPMIGHSDDGRPDERRPIEVHWRLDNGSQPERLPVDELWSRLEPWSVAGAPARRLSVVDAALHLCHHAVAQHRLAFGLRSLCDLAYVTQSWDEHAWDVFVERALGYGLQRSVYLLLVLAGPVLGPLAPPAIMQRLAHTTPPLPDDQIVEWAASWAEAEVYMPAAAAQAAGQSSWVARLRRLLWHLFPPRKVMAVVYGVAYRSPRIWLTYLWRPVDLLRRYGAAVWSAARGAPAARAAWTRQAWLERWLNVDLETQ